MIKVHNAERRNLKVLSLAHLVFGESRVALLDTTFYNTSNKAGGAAS
jgi:hypothetical protein